MMAVNDFGQTRASVSLDSGDKFAENFHHHVVDTDEAYLSNTDLADDECNLLAQSDDDEGDNNIDKADNIDDVYGSGANDNTHQHVARRLYCRLVALVSQLDAKVRWISVNSKNGGNEANKHNAMYKQLDGDPLRATGRFQPIATANGSADHMQSNHRKNRIGDGFKSTSSQMSKNLAANDFEDPAHRRRIPRFNCLRWLWMILLTLIVLWLLSVMFVMLTTLIAIILSPSQMSYSYDNQLQSVISNNSHVQSDKIRKLDQPSTNKNLSEQHDQDRWLIATPKCHIPVLDPWHESIKEYVEAKPPMDCKKIFAESMKKIETSNDTDKQQIRSNTLTYVQDNRLFFTHDAINRGAGINGKCCYRSIARTGDNDDELEYSRICRALPDSNPITLTSIGLDINEELIQIECAELKYTNVHVFMIHDTAEEKALKALADKKLIIGKHYNVLMVGVDTISRLNAIRQLPKTLNVLRQLYNTTEFLGYNKVGENTFPNLVPLLTGLTPEQLVQVTCWAATNYTEESEKGDDYLDNCKFLWTFFQQSGYTTYFSEDWPEASTFDYLKPGFKQKPTDFYGRPFTLARDALLYPHKEMACSSCHLDEPIVRVDLNNLNNFVKTHNNMPYFAFHWINCPQHDDLNGASKVDDIIADFFINLYNITYNQRTFVVFFSDHGYRWNNFVSTQIGHYESSLPLLTIAPPAVFAREHPLEYMTLTKNYRALMTPFNVFHTMIQIKRLGEKESHSKRKAQNEVVTIGTNLYQVGSTSRNSTNETPVSTEASLRLLDGLSYPQNISTYSLFEEQINQDRSCIETGIPDNYCVCHNFEKVSIDDEDVLAAAYYLVYVHMAGKIANSRQLCDTLNLSSIKEANMFDFGSMKSKTSSRRRRAVVNLQEYNNTLHNRTEIPKPSKITPQPITTTQPPEQEVELSKLNKYHSLPNREYNIRLETQPGGGLFQEVVRYYGDNLDECKNAAKSIRTKIEDPEFNYDEKINAVIDMDKSCEFSVHSDSISRLNLYGKQSKCVKNNIELKKICHCKDQT